MSRYTKFYFIPKNIYFSGSHAAYDTSIITTIATKDENEYSIYCTAPFSCGYKILQTANNLYCVGWNSCVYTNLIQFINNVWMYGYTSGQHSIIMDIDHNVYCGAREACYSANISNVKGNVYVSGFKF